MIFSSSPPPATGGEEKEEGAKKKERENPEESHSLSTKKQSCNCSKIVSVLISAASVERFSVSRMKDLKKKKKCTKVIQLSQC